MIQGIEDQKSDAGAARGGDFCIWTRHHISLGKERGIAMFGFLTFGTTLALTDLAVKRDRSQTR